MKQVVPLNRDLSDWLTEEIAARITSLTGVEIRRFRKSARLFGQQADVNRVRDAIEQMDLSILQPGPAADRGVAKTKGQAHFLQAVRDYDLTFCTGPAGTGKTYIAVAAALEQMRARKLKRLVMMRPVVEAGEKLGYLPGTADEKMAPYMAPLHDALDKKAGKHMPAVEVVPLAYARGRTFESAVVILDEAQNTTPAQMFMALTRLGEGSKMIVTGDCDQSDISGTDGLSTAIKCLTDCHLVQHIRLTEADIVRHPVVREVIECWK